MASVSGINSIHPSAVAQQLAREASSSRASSQISSLAPQVQREIVGVELYVKSALAGLVGVVPFITSKVGEGIVKASAFTALGVRNFARHFENTGVRLAEIVFRAIIGVPASVGGALLFGGAVGFSKSQSLVWGQDLIEHPQEERINTKLARYGAGEKPLLHFGNLLIAFFLPLKWPSLTEGIDFRRPLAFGKTDRISEILKDLLNFKAP